MEKKPQPRLVLPRSSSGFTIVEVMLATFVMFFGIVSSILVLQGGYKAIDTARNTTLAAQIMQSEMERIRLLSWNAVAALPSTETIDLNTIFPAGTTTNLLAHRYTAVRTSAEVSGKVGEMKEIGLVVTWRGIDGLTHTRSTTTQYAKNGLYDYYYTRARP